MAYKKVYYEQLGTACSQIENRCYEWEESLGNIQKQINALIEKKPLKGSGAESIYNYLNEVHGLTIQLFMTLLETNKTAIEKYLDGYHHSVDSGADPDIYTTLVYAELSKQSGTVDSRFKGYMNRADSIASSANRFASSVSDLVSLSMIRSNDLIDSMKTAVRFATDVNQKIIDHESKSAPSLNDPKTLLEQINKIISQQLSESRMPVTNYPSGGIATMVDAEKLSASIDSCVKTVEDWQKSEHYERAANLTVGYEQHVTDIHTQEEQESRQWAKWAAVGVAVVGGAILTVVTAGAAGPVAVVAVGALTGAATAAANSFADNYVKTGSFTEGMDWNKFTKDVVIGGVVGGVSAYFGAANSVGSAIKQPIKGALRSAGQSLVENGVKIGLSVGWDVGEAVVNKRSVSWSEIWDNNKDLVKEGLVDTATSFAGGWVDTKVSITDASTAKKTAKQVLKDGTIKNLTSAGSGLAANAAWDIGEGLITGDKDKMLKNLENDVKKAGMDFAKDELKTVGSSVKTGVSNKIDQNEKAKQAAQKKAEGNTPKAVVTESKTKNSNSDKIAKGIGTFGKNFAKGSGGKALDTVTDTVTEHVTGERKGPLTLEEIGKDLKDNSADIVGDGAKEAVNESIKDAKKNNPDYTQNQVKKQQNIFSNKVDTVETVSFEGYETKSFTKTDYDAAVEVAGKGAYKDMSVADVLGIHDREVDTSKPIYGKVDADKIANAPGVNRSNAQAIKNPNYGK